MCSLCKMVSDPYPLMRERDISSSMQGKRVSKPKYMEVVVSSACWTKNQQKGKHAIISYSCPYWRLAVPLSNRDTQLPKPSITSKMKGCQELAKKFILILKVKKKDVEDQLSKLQQKGDQLIPIACHAAHLYHRNVSPVSDK